MRLTALLILAAASSLAAADKLQLDFNVPLWPEGKVPLAVGSESVDRPFLTVVLPPEDKRSGAAVIVAPGGGNLDLLPHEEGLAVAEKLNSWGVTAFVLAYRLSPRYKADARLLDGQRAIQIVRTRAAEWKIDPHRVGMIGFSAGGEMVRIVSRTFVPGDPQAEDPIAKQSSRLNFAGYVYGVGRGARDEVLKDYPPSFLIVSAADRGPAAGSAQLTADLLRAGVSAELHIYQGGRHGFGTAEWDPIAGDWMPRFRNWMQHAGFLKGNK